MHRIANALLNSHALRERMVPFAGETWSEAKSAGCTPPAERSSGAEEAVEAVEAVAAAASAAVPVAELEADADADTDLLPLGDPLRLGDPLSAALTES